MNLVPPPCGDCTSIVPPSRCKVVSTTSRPTPRPEISVTELAVEKPGRKISASISASLMRLASSADNIPS